MKRSITGIIEEVITDSNRIPPILVDLPNEENKTEVQNMDCGLFYCKRSKKSVLALANENLVYKSYSPNEKKKLTSTIIAICNKKTGKIKLVSAERWNMTPVIQENCPDITKADENPNNSLTKVFGSKRCQLDASIRESLKVDLNSFKEEIETSIDDLQIETADPNPNQESELIMQTNLPLCNEDATDVKYVYRLNDIIPKYILATLYEIAKDTLVNGFPEKDGLFADIFQKITKPKRKKKISTLIYLRAISKWLGISAKAACQVNVVKENYNLSQEVAEYIIETFTIQTNNKRQRPPSIKDKAIIHCMLLVLTLCDYQIDLELFIKVVAYRISIKKLAQFAKIMRLVADKTNKNVYKLKLPLPKEQSLYVQRRK